MKASLATSGKEAQRMLRWAANTGTPFRLVLCDVHMPEMDGFELSQRILRDPVTAGTRIVLLTSGGQRGDSARCRELGIASYLTKPIRQSELREALVTILGTGSAPGYRSIPVTRHSLREAQPKRRVRILVAEDNPVNQTVVRRSLERQGCCDIVVVDNGRKAVDALVTEDYDAVLMDVQMPEMDGFEATAEIRRREIGTGKHQLIIAMTAHAMKGDRENCLAAGMDDYLSKPARPQELASLLDRIRKLELPLPSGASVPDLVIPA